MDQVTATASQWTTALDRAMNANTPAARTAKTGTDFQAALQHATLEQPGEPAEKSALPLEAYALPEWYVAYVPDQCVLRPAVNHAYWAKAEAFSADGVMTKEEESILWEMKENDQVRATELANEEWRREHKTELSEYFDILHTAFTEALAENGVEGPEDYYRKVVLDPAGSEQVRQDMQSRLDEQPRFWELMDELGVQA